MKIKSTLFLLLVVNCFLLQAQYRCIPSLQNFGYPGGVDLDPSQVGTIATPYFAPGTPPQWTRTFKIPFPFYFNGQLVQYYKVSNTGILTFDTTVITAPTPGNRVYPSTAIPDKSICIGGIQSGYMEITEIGTNVTARPDWCWIVFDPATDVNGGEATWSIILEDSTNNIYLATDANDGAVAPLSLGIQVNSATAYMAPGSPNIVAPGPPAELGHHYPVYYAFIPESSILSDGAVTNCSQQEFEPLNKGPFPVKALFKNLGVDTLHSLRLNYSVNGAPPVSQTFSNLNLPNGAGQWFSFTTPWSPTVAATYTLDIYADNLSTGADQDSTNNHFLRSVVVADSLPALRPLFEELKGTWCINSGYWTKNYDTLLNGNSSRVSSVKYESGSGDYLAWDLYDNTYRGPVYPYPGIPCAVANGQIAPISDTAVPYYDFVGNPWNVTQKMIDSLCKLYSPYFVQPALYRNGNFIQANVKLTSAINIPATDSVRFYTALIEDSIFQPNAYYNSGETLFVHTTRTFLSTGNGYHIANSAAGHIDSFSFAYHITDTTCNLNRLRVVSFVQDMNSLKILQSGEAPIVPYNLAIPYIPIIAGDSFYCPGTYTALRVANVFAGARYYWSNGDTGVTAHAASTGYYSVTAVNNFGSAVSDSFYVSQGAAPARPVIRGDTLICPGYANYLNISSYCNYCNYYWEVNYNIDPRSYTNYASYYFGYNADSLAYYTVVVANTCGVDSAHFAVTKKGTNAFTYPRILGGQVACPAHPATLYVQNPCMGCSYVWNDSIYSDSITITTGGNYNLKILTDCGVQYVTDYEVGGAPQPLIITGDTIACNSDAEINVSNNCVSCTMVWNTDTFNYYGNFDLSLNSAGYNYFRAYNICGTTDVDSIFIYGLPDRPMLSYKDSFCSGLGDTISVTNSLPNYSYSWWPNTNETNPEAIISQSGYYYVTVTNPYCPYYSYGVSESYTDFITAVTSPSTETIEGKPYICYSYDYLYVQSGASDVNYLWNTGSSDNYIYAYTPGTYSVIKSNGCGVDTSYFTVFAPDTVSSYVSICPGTSYNFHGTNETRAGIYNYKINSINNCDSVVAQLHLFLRKPDSTLFNASVCNGGSYLFFGTNETTAGTYSHTLQNRYGCDSVIILHLTFNGADSTSFNASVCTGGSYPFFGTNETVAGVYSYTLQNRFGCDSVVSLHLSVHTSDSTSSWAYICHGASFPFFGTNETVAGTYSHVLQNRFGCDSVVIMHLAFNRSDSTSFSASVCNGSSYSFFGTNETTAGTYSHTLYNSLGCDSVVTLHLTFNVADSTSFTASVCNGVSYPFFGTNETSTGTYSHTLQNGYGCDSVVTLHLAVNRTDSTSLSATICSNQTYPFFGTNETATGSYSHTLQNMHGCDSVVTLNLTVNPAYTSSFSASICPNSSYNFYGKNKTATGYYSDTLQSISGCDSIITLHLMVLTPDTTSFTIAICTGETYTFFGRDISRSGSFSNTLQNVKGCDSVIVLHLLVRPVINNQLQVSLCQGDVYNAGHLSIDTAGVYTDTLQSVYGCDSIITLHVTLGPDTVLVIGTDTLMLSGSGTVQWINCTTGLPVSGATGNFFVPQTTGSYSAIITYGSCTDTTSCFPIVATGISNIKNDPGNVSLYPNPSNGSWQLEVSNAWIGAQLEVLDEEGRLVFHSTLTGIKSMLNLIIPAGMYYLHINNATGTVVRKMIKL